MEARLIGDIISRYQANINDGWIAGRIGYLIRIGKIWVAKEAERRLRRLIFLA